MIHVDFKQISSRYKRELLENCLPFWLENSQDKEFGGYYSCLNRDGSVYDTDKFREKSGMARLRYPGRRVLEKIRTRRKLGFLFLS